MNQMIQELIHWEINQEFIKISLMDERIIIRINSLMNVSNDTRIN